MVAVWIHALGQVLASVFWGCVAGLAESMPILRVDRRPVNLSKAAQGAVHARIEIGHERNKHRLEGCPASTR